METEDKVKIGIIAAIIIIVVATIIAGSIIRPKPSQSLKEKNESKEVEKKKTETKEGTKTFEVLATYESNDEKYIHVTIRQFQSDDIVTVKILKELIKDIHRNDNYEFKFEYNPDQINKDDLKSIFDNSKIISISKTDKKGLDQVNDF